MTPAQVLRDAKALIANPERWCRGAWTRCADGLSAHCAVGAVWRVTGCAPSSGPARCPALRFIMDEVPNGGDIYAFNDDAKHPEVLAMFDRAIAKAEETEA
jgi:hypothetical protein